MAVDVNPFIRQRTSASSTGRPLQLPVVALAVGFVFRPWHVWLIWLAAVLIQWVAIFVFGDDGDLGRNETHTSITVEAVGWTAIGARGPVRAGLLVRWIIEDEPLMV